MRAMRGRPVTPQGGLNVGQYDRQVKETAAQKKKEYKDMLDQVGSGVFAYSLNWVQGESFFLEDLNECSCFNDLIK